MESKKPNGKHSVNLNKKSNLSSTRVEKNKNIQPKKVSVLKDESFKKEILKEEKDSKLGLIIGGVVFVLIVGTLIYFNVAKDDDKEKNKKDSNEVEDIVTPIVEEKVEEVAEPVTVVNPVKVVAKQEEKYYSLSFETNGGTTIGKVSYESKDKTKTPNMPQKENWIFMGWYLDENFEEQYLFDTVLTQDTTIYAKWGKKICFKLEGASETCMTTTEPYVAALDEKIPLLPIEDLDDSILETMGYNPDENDLGWFFTFIVEDEPKTSEVLPGRILTEDMILEQYDSVDLVLHKVEKFEIKLLQENEEPQLDPTQLGTIDAYEGRPIDFEEADAIVRTELNNSDIEFSWYYIVDNNRFDIQRDMLANTSITKLYISVDTATITYYKPTAAIDAVISQEDGVITEDQDSDVEPNVEKIISKKYTINSNVELLELEEIEGYIFIGWFIFDDNGNISSRASTFIGEANMNVIGKWISEEDYESLPLPPRLAFATVTETETEDVVPVVEEPIPEVEEEVLEEEVHEEEVLELEQENITE